MINNIEIYFQVPSEIGNLTNLTKIGVIMMP